MKKKVLIIFMSACSLGYAQLGVNTTEITSTLTVQGSIAANYREITNATYAIQKDDYNISYRGNSGEGVFYLPSIEGSGDSFGRMYNIKNLSTKQNLVVRTLGTQFLQFGGENPDRVTEFTIYPGQHLYVVANKDNNWIVYDVNDSSVAKTVYISNAITENSVIRLGNYSFRILKTDQPRAGDMYLQIRSHKNQADNMITTTAYNDIFRERKSFRTSIDYLRLDNKNWVNVNKQGGFTLSPGYVISHDTLITIKSTGELFRVICTVFGELGNSPEIKRLVIRVERLR
ncbi:hypothetical protein [Myroides odoratus]|uniref:hypothetical protein n=1 Tax=Myroides odoratus TaxID=256 RepID=UPI00333F1230